MTAPSQEFLSFIQTMLRREHRDDLIDPDTALSALGFDSFGKVQLLVAVEEEFNVSIPEAELTRENFHTVRSLWSLVDRRLDDGESQPKYVEET